MPESFKAVSISSLIFNRRGTPAFRLLLAAFGIALKLFFRRIETVNADVVPKQAGVIFVLNHPNGLIDPALVFIALPRKISFLAKSTLFRTPVISSILKTVEALPVYRKMDPGEDLSKNQLTFQSARDRLMRGGSIALFPEGLSHNSPKLLPIKTGAARIALGAAAAGPGSTGIDIRIVPVGLYYTSKTTFRSEALIHFGEPFDVPRVPLTSEGDPPRDAVKELTNSIEAALREVTLNAETEAELHTAAVAEEVFAASAETEYLGDKVNFLKRYISRRPANADGGEIESKLLDYDRKLEKYGIEPVHLSLSQFSRGFVIRQAIVQTWWLIILAPFALVGAVLHFPAYQICKVFAYYFTHHGADDIVSTVKVLAAMVFIPATWLITVAVIYYFFGWEMALLSMPVSILLGYAALYTLEEAAGLRGWARALWLYLTRKETFLRLFVERRELQEQLRPTD